MFLVIFLCAFAVIASLMVLVTTIVDINQKTTPKPKALSYKPVTVGIYSIQNKYSDTKKQYSIDIILKEGSGKKELLFVTNEDFGAELDEFNSRRTVLVNYASRLDIYLLKLTPWLEGTLSTEDLKLMETGIKWVEKPVISNLNATEIADYNLVKETNNDD